MTRHRCAVLLNPSCHDPSCTLRTPPHASRARRCLCAYALAAAVAASLLALSAVANEPPPPPHLCTPPPSALHRFFSAQHNTPPRHPHPPRRRAATIIACVGDIHGRWGVHDERALRALNPDLALFVGDYGDEDVEITRRIRAFADSVPFGVATVFGNHDAHYSTNLRRRMRSPFGAGAACRVSAQLDQLAPHDVTYAVASFRAARLCVCGGRSFSAGGPVMHDAPFFRRFLRVSGLRHSAARIRDALARTPCDSVAFLAHVGPSGLGPRPHDPCGRDWGPCPGGDFGDTDLRAGIEHARARGLRVPLVVFGHMHKRLVRGLGERVMVKTEPDGMHGRQTVMVNAAVVPRHRRDGRGRTLHHFQIVRMAEGGDVRSVEETWVRANGAVADVATMYEAGGVAGATSESARSTVTE